MLVVVPILTSFFLACGVTQTVAHASGYPGLDRFGRLLDLHYKDASDATLHRYEYGYDLASNRTHCRVTQVADASTSHDNDRSWLYAYDPLNRLIDARMGQLDSGWESLTSSYPTPQEIHWYLDNLGNWSGTAYDANSNFGGGRTWTDGTDQTVQHHTVNSANQIKVASSQPATMNAGDLHFIHDPAGNMVWDGTYYYQYDSLMCKRLGFGTPRELADRMRDLAAAFFHILRTLMVVLRRGVVRTTPAPYPRAA